MNGKVAGMSNTYDTTTVLMKARYTLLAIAALLTACTHLSRERPASFLGDPGSLGAATQTIIISPDTKWVNVTGGDTVKFVVGDRAFAWVFNVAEGVSTFDLARVAPPGLLKRRVDAYVGPDPRYISGDGNNRNEGR